MDTVANFAVLVISTLLAASAAVLLDWILLQAMFRLMRPAATKQTPAPTFRSELVHGTRQITRHFGPAAVRR